jgi:hypothetical protein
MHVPRGHFHVQQDRSPRLHGRISQFVPWVTVAAWAADAIAFFIREPHHTLF